MNLDDRLRDLLSGTGDDLTVRPAGAARVAAAARRRTARNRMVAGTAAVVALGGLAVTGTLLGSSDSPEPPLAIDAPVDDPAARGPESGDPESSDPAVASAAQEGAPLAATATLTRLVPTGNGYAAVGDLGATGLIGLWTSTDGLSWSAAPVPVPEEGAFLSTAAATGTRIIVGGLDLAGAPLVAVTDDGGTSWTRASLPVSSGSVGSIAAGDGGVVVSLAGEPATTLWSPDGLSFGAEDQTTHPLGDVTTLAAGSGFVRIDFAGATSVSPDGRTWSPASLDTGGGFVAGAAATGSTVLAVGSDPKGAAVAAWFSSDAGATWRTADELLAALAPTDPAAPAPFFSGLVAGGPGGLALVTSTVAADGTSSSQLLSSPDGIGWTVTPLGELLPALGDGTAFPAGLVVRDTSVVVAAGSTDPAQAGQLTWVLTPLG
jgi:hypothetical protein